MNRRDYIKKSGLTIAGIGLSGLAAPAVFAKGSLYNGVYEQSDQNARKSVVDISLNEKFYGCICG